MPDSSIVDSLSIQLEASAKGSKSAIDSLQKSLAKLQSALNPIVAYADGYEKSLESITSGFEHFSRVVGNIDMEGLNAAAKSMKSFTNSILGIDKAMTSLTELPSKTSYISKSLRGLFDYYGIDKEKDIEKISASFGELYEAMYHPKGVDNSKSILDGIIEDIRTMSNVTREAEGYYTDLYNAIKRIGKNTVVHIPKGSGKEYRDGDLLGLLSTMGGGKHFTTGQGTVDFQEWVHEIIDQIGKGIIPEHYGNDGESTVYLHEFAETCRKARQEAESFAKGGEKIKFSYDDIVPSIITVDDAVKDAVREWEEATAKTENASPFKGIASGLESLKGVTIPDMSNLASLADAVKRLGGEKAESAAANLKPIAEGLKAFDASVSIPDVGGLPDLIDAVRKTGSDTATKGRDNLLPIAEGLKAFSGVTIPDFGNLAGLAEFIHKLGNKVEARGADNLPKIAQALSQFSFIELPDFSGLASLGNAVNLLGRKQTEQAANNLPIITQSLNDLVSSLGSLPDVSDNTIRLVEALGNLNASNIQAARSFTRTSQSAVVFGVNVGNLAQKIVNGITNPLAKAYTQTNTFKSGISLAQKEIIALGKTAANSLRGVTNITGFSDKLKNSFAELSHSFMRLRSVVWGLKSIGTMFNGLTESASSLTEVQNVIEHVYDPSYINEFNEACKDTIGTLGMSKLTFQQFASRYQAMGKALGITNDQMRSAETFLGNLGIEYGTVSGKMGDMSVNLTRLAGDMASFYDVDVSDVYQSLQAVYTGQTRPLMLAA